MKDVQAVDMSNALQNLLNEHLHLLYNKNGMSMSITGHNKHNWNHLKKVKTNVKTKLPLFPLQNLSSTDGLEVLEKNTYKQQHMTWNTPVKFTT